MALTQQGRNFHFGLLHKLHAGSLNVDSPNIFQTKHSTHSRGYRNNNLIVRISETTCHAFFSCNTNNRETRSLNAYRFSHRRAAAEKIFGRGRADNGQLPHGSYVAIGEKLSLSYSVVTHTWIIGCSAQYARIGILVAVLDLSIR